MSSLRNSLHDPSSSLLLDFILADLNPFPIPAPYLFRTTLIMS